MDPKSVYEFVRQESSVRVKVPKPGEYMNLDEKNQCWRYGEVVGSDDRGRLILFNRIYFGFTEADLGREKCADIRIEIKIMPDGRKYTLVAITKATDPPIWELVRVNGSQDGAIMLLQAPKVGLSFRRLVPRVRKETQAAE